jgi:uncharacterized protein Yka (UPF0111/DUF47 family)
MALATQTEICVHEAIISSLVLSDLQSKEQEAVAADEGRHKRIDGHVKRVVEAANKCVTVHSQLMEVLRTGDFSRVGDKNVINLAFHFDEITSNLETCIQQAWEIAPKLTVRQKEYCKSIQELEGIAKEIEEVTETWCMAADVDFKRELKSRIDDAGREASGGAAKDWRELVASLQG